jgi:c-di-GMP-binding flagellar brake protein YcgR
VNDKKMNRVPWAGSSLADQGPQEIDRIYLERRNEFFEELKKRRSFLYLRVLGHDYQRLTCMTGLEKKGAKRYLLVDCPEGFVEQNRSLDRPNVRIDLMGPDQLQYTFKTAVVKILDRDIWLEFPEFVERIQRRGYFRISPPPGTVVVLPCENQALEAEVVNLSVGGSLLKVSGVRQGDMRLKIGDRISGATLICRTGAAQQGISIGETTVRRVEKDSETGRLFCALEFTRMNRKEARALSQFIFQCEIDIIRRRALSMPVEDFD